MAGLKTKRWSPGQRRLDPRAAFAKDHLSPWLYSCPALSILLWADDPAACFYSKSQNPSRLW